MMKKRNLLERSFSEVFMYEDELKNADAVVCLCHVGNQYYINGLIEDDEGEVTDEPVVLWGMVSHALESVTQYITQMEAEFGELGYLTYRVNEKETESEEKDNGND